ARIHAEGARPDVEDHRSRRRHVMISHMRRHPVSGFLLGILALAALNTALHAVWVLQTLPQGLLALAAAVAAGYAIGHRPGARTPGAGGGAAADGEVARLRAEAAALRDQREQAGAAVAIAVCWLEQARAGGEGVPVNDLIGLALDELGPVPR